MNVPPLGYDDDTVIAQNQLRKLLGQFENELNKIRSVFQQYLPGQFQVPIEIEDEFWHLRISAEELGSEYSFLVERLISDYENFRKLPDPAKLDQIFSDVKSLELLLTG